VERYMSAGGFGSKGWYGLRGVFRYLRDSFTIKEDDAEFGEMNQGINMRADGTKLRHVPTAYRSMLDDPATISRHLIETTLLYYKKAMMFENMSARIPEIEILKRGASLTKAEIRSKAKQPFSAVKSRLKDIIPAGQTSFYKKTQDLVDMQVYGIQKARLPLFTTKSGYTLDLSKVFFGAIRAASASNLANNIMVIASNWIGAEINLKIESAAKYYFSNKSYGLATMELVKNVGNIIDNAYGARNDSKLLGMLRYFNIVASTEADMKKMHGNGLVNFIRENIWYGPYSAGDFMVKAKMMTAMLIDIKYTDNAFYNRQQYISKYFNGNRKLGDKAFDRISQNMYDAIGTKKDGTIFFKDEYKHAVNEDMINTITLKAQRLAGALDGVLTANDKSKFHSTIIGSALLLHRGFLITALQNRLHGKYFDYEQGEITNGQYPGAFNYVKHSAEQNETYRKILKFLHLKVKDLQDLENNMPTAHESYSFRKTANEIKWMLYLAVSSHLIYNLYDAEDDPDKKKWLLRIFALMMRLNFEQNSVYWPADTYGVMKSPTAAQGFFDQTTDFLGFLYDGTGNELVQSGKYKYMPKWQRSIIKASPLRHAYEDFGEREDLKSKIRYMEPNIGPIYNATERIFESKQVREERLRKELDKQRRKEIQDRITESQRGVAARD
jgi:hypothetical protein